MTVLMSFVMTVFGMTVYDMTDATCPTSESEIGKLYGWSGKELSS